MPLVWWALHFSRSSARPPLTSGPRCIGSKARSFMYAIVEIGGKQFKVQKDQQLVVPRLNADIGDTVSVDRVLLVGGSDDVQVGAPTVDGFTASLKVLDHVKGDKIIVFKKKRRKGYKVKNGHRQPYTRVAVTELAS